MRAIYAGVDLGLQCAAVVWRDHHGIHSDVIKAERLPNYASERERIGRLAYVTQKVVKAVRFSGANLVGIEGYALGRAGSGMIFSIAECGGAVRYALWHELGLYAVSVNPTTARMLVLGKGTLKKKEVAARVRKMHTWFTTDDEADAFVVLRALEIVDSTQDISWTPAAKRLQAAVASERQRAA